MNKQLNASFTIVAFVALLLSVAGCASASTSTSSTPSLVGTIWVTTITEEEAPVFKGQYEMTLADNGRVLVVTSTGGGMVTNMGTHTVTQDQVFFTDERSECFKLGFPTATYKWSVEHDTLLLTAIDDRCYSRRKIAERTWARKTTVGTSAPTTMPLLK